jgi:hypothetical protein
MRATRDSPPRLDRVTKAGATGSGPDFAHPGIAIVLRDLKPATPGSPANTGVAAPGGVGPGLSTR